MSLRNEIADILWNAQQSQTPCVAPTTSHPEITLADAYAIQQVNLERRLNQKNPSGQMARLVGRKVGITSRTVQEWLGVGEPDFGGLLDTMEVPNHGSASVAPFIQPRVEGEIAFVLKSCLVGPGISTAQAIAAVDFILPAIEIIDSRVIDWKFKIEDTVADNASSAMFVLGSRPYCMKDVDLRTIGVTLRKNGEVVSTGAGAACLGNPVNALVWLANKLGEFGEQLNKGQVILSGALCPVSPVVAGDVITTEIGNLGEVAVTFRS
jgi:2-oxopent-4-enoate hydratase